MITRRRIGWLLIVLGLLISALWLARVGLTANALRTHFDQLRATAKQADLAPTCEALWALQDDLVALRRDAGGFVALAPLFRWLPIFGNDLDAAPRLLSAGDDLAEAGSLLCEAFARSGEREATLGAVLRVLAENQPLVQQAAARAARAEQTLASVPSDALSPLLASRVQTLQRAAPLVRAGLQLATLAPHLGGFDQPRTYLLLALNEDELRPGGGFISSAGRLTVRNGQIVELNFLDANLVDDYLNKSYPYPPEPLFKYMWSEMWLFRDANWSPDFPTSARQAAAFYEYGQGVSVDGVIAFDQRLVEMLLSALGPIQVSGITEPVTATNVRQLMRAAWNPDSYGVTLEWALRRKDFVGQFAAAIRERIESGRTNVDWLQVGIAMHRALVSRHLMIYVNHSEAAGVLSKLGWDGALRQSEGDYLMVVNANLGFGKVNPLVKKRIDYQVTLNADGTAIADLSLKYTHQGWQEGVRCQHSFSYTGNLTYEMMMHRCYYNYLRVLTPLGSVLRAATAHPTPGEYLLRGQADDGQAVTLTEENKTVFAQFFVVEYGKSLTTRFTYDLPDVAKLGEGKWRYTLLMQKQAGAEDIPVLLKIAIPPRAKLLMASPSPHMIDGNLLTFEFLLDSDIVIKVIYE